MSPIGSPPSLPARDPAGSASGAWAGVPERLRARGLRWTPQRRVLVDVLSRTDGHVTGAELVERCRTVDPAVLVAVEAFELQRGFEIDISHLSLIGRCAACRSETPLEGHA